MVLSYICLGGFGDGRKLNSDLGANLAVIFYEGNVCNVEKRNKGVSLLIMAMGVGMETMAILIMGVPDHADEYIQGHTADLNKQI